jgi:hypothetical protein
MSTRLILFICLLIVALASGCSGPSASDQPDPPVEEDKVAETARIVCDRDGPRVLTPKVETRTDGVHLAVDNRLEGNADLSVDHSDIGMGWSVPAGESERVANVPPGTVRISCYSRSWGREKALTVDSGTIKVLAGDSGYKSTKLDCPRGKLVGGTGPYSEEEMGEQKGDPVELLRRELSGSLREGDVVEIAGNTQSRDEKTVRVVRDGEVVANAHYMQVSDGWLGGLTENCAKS